MEIHQLYTLYQQNPSIQTDTRKLQKGDIYFALKGPNFNGNTFSGTALERGAVYAIVDDQKYATHERVILVDDVLTTLQALAKYHRLQFNIPFIAITGSNGKTTTKELIHAVLSSTYKTYTTQGNLNNHIGIPVTILSVRKDANMAIIEMGANHEKEIESYCSFTMPTHGIITNCGKAHLEGFGSIEGVRKAKGELFDFLRKNDGTAFINSDYGYLETMSKGIRKKIKYGTIDGNVVGNVEKSSPFLTVQIQKGIEMGLVKTRLIGDYNLPNVLAAVTIGKYFSIEDQKIKAAIENYSPSNSRSQLVEKNSNKIILDAYNANPSSMKAAIENFAQLPSERKVLILGGMAELGSESLEEHNEIIKLISNHRWSDVVLVGGDFNNLKHPFKKFLDAAEAAQWFNKQHFKDTYFLIKGSRSMQMEKVLNDL